MIYLIHHGDALPREVDPQRPLSHRGRADTDRVANAAAARGVRPAVIWHSGKLRARQTAEAFRRACNPLASLTAVRGLQPSDPPEWMADQLRGEAREVMLVGHMPNLERLLNLLTEGRADGERRFPAHGLVALDEDGDRWVERWTLGPAEI